MKNQLAYFILLLAIFTVIIISPLQAQDAPTKVTKKELTVGPATTILFDEIIYDFGKVKEGTEVTHVFTFTNTGQETLKIIGARGSCGCTVPRWPQYPIQPGETASLTVVFNTKNKFGMRNQKVTLYANTEPRESFVYVKGEIEKRPEGQENIASINKKEAPGKQTCLRVFPNPTSETIKLEMDDTAIGQEGMISIFAQNGQLMAQRNLNTLDKMVEFNVIHYPVGNYVANIKVGNQPAETICFVVAR